MPEIKKSDIGIFHGKRRRAGIRKAKPKPKCRRKDAWSRKLEQLNVYRASGEWQEKRTLILERDENTCRLCGRMEVLLEVHHLTYSNLYDEPLHHLITLCHACHRAIHYGENGKRRRDWKKYNPKPVLTPPAQTPEPGATSGGNSQ